MSKVVFHARAKPTNKSYPVTFFDANGIEYEWQNSHGGPHVETEDEIEPGTERIITGKIGENRYSIIYALDGVQNSRSKYGGHITVPK
jgi:hypothetical protein